LKLPVHWTIRTNANILGCNPFPPIHILLAYYLRLSAFMFWGAPTIVQAVVQSMEENNDTLQIHDIQPSLWRRE
jgi:hypothetical protein